MNDISLLGGALRGKTRPRGFAPWKPQSAVLRLLDQVRTVLAELGIREELERWLP